MPAVKFFSSLFFGAVLANQAWACTYVSLEGDDGTMVAARTMEWGTFDNKPEVAYAPAGSKFKSSRLGDHKDAGKTWTSDYAIMGMSAMRGQIDETLFADGVNSEGLTVHFLYHPGTPEYPDYIESEKDNTITVLDFASYILSKCKSVRDAQKKIDKIRIVGKYEESIKSIVPAHFTIADKKGNEIVVEFIDKEVKIYEDTVGVMTNSPSYDWHLTNLRNYLYMKQSNVLEHGESVRVGDVDLFETGYGTGLLGLPGDYTPVSRFVRAVALRQLSRRTDGGEDTVREVIRILQGFQLPYELSKEQSYKDKDWDVMKYGSTLWTCAYDLKNLKMYYRTAKIPSIRVLDFNKVDFKNMSKDERTFFALDTDIDYATDVTPTDLSSAEL